MKWFKENWKIIPIVLYIPVLVMVSIMFWFYTDAYLMWNPENFNNIVSPIAGLISGLLVIFALRQTAAQGKIIFRQHELIESQHALDDLNQEYQAVERALKKDFSLFVLTSVAVPNGTTLESRYKDLKINFFDFADFLRGEIASLTEDSDYIEDNTDFLNGKYHHIGHYRKRNYRRTLRSILQTGTVIDAKLTEVRYLLKKVKASKLTTEAQISFRRKIEINWLKDYITFIKFESLIEIPNLKNVKAIDEVLWVELSQTNISAFLRENEQYFG